MLKAMVQFNARHTFKGCLASWCDLCGLSRVVYLVWCRSRPLSGWRHNRIRGNKFHWL